MRPAPPRPAREHGGSSAPSSPCGGIPPLSLSVILLLPNGWARLTSSAPASLHSSMTRTSMSARTASSATTTTGALGVLRRICETLGRTALRSTRLPFMWIVPALLIPTRIRSPFLGLPPCRLRTLDLETRPP